MLYNINRIFSTCTVNTMYQTKYDNRVRNYVYDYSLLDNIDTIYSRKYFFRLESNREKFVYLTTLPSLSQLEPTVRSHSEPTFSPLCTPNTKQRHASPLRTFMGIVVEVLKRRVPDLLVFKGKSKAVSTN